MGVSTALVKDVKVRARINLLIMELRDKGDLDQRPGRQGTQKRLIVDVPEIELTYEELEQRIADISEIVIHGHQLIEEDPPEVVTDDVTGLSATGAILNGTATTNSVSSTLSFDFDTTPHFDANVVADESPMAESAPTAFHKDMGGLTASTKYYYRAVIQDARKTAYGIVKSFVTPAAP
jgi:hypothetical protein